MKRIILASAIALFLLPSCKKCYKCELRTTFSPNAHIGNTVTETEYCGSKKDMQAFEEQGTRSVQGGSGADTFTQTMVRTCR